jgi:uncharacterized protein YqgV (UPF0045/DUF77 family)
LYTFENKKMKVGVEVSMYPLHKDFEKDILEFIKNLNSFGLKTQTNGMSTQVFGEFDEIFLQLNQAMKTAFSNGNQIVFNLKVLNNPLPSDFSL